MAPLSDLLPPLETRAGARDASPEGRPAAASTEREGSHASDCDDPECGGCEDAPDDSHSHSHAHSHATSVDALGVSSFAYERSDRPFDYGRLLDLVKRWPIPQKDGLDLQDLRPGGSGVPGVASEWEAVLRSKGHVWLETHPRRAVQWTYAGRHFALEDAGPWDDGETPKSQLVVIGLDIDEDRLRADLDACLVTDAQLADYERRAQSGVGHRFALGQAVECNLGAVDGWVPGTVVAHDYQEEGWPEPAPYQIQLNDGTLIFAPADIDDVIRSQLNVQSAK